MAWTEHHACTECLKMHIDQIRDNKPLVNNPDCPICKGTNSYWKIYAAPKGRF